MTLWEEREMARQERVTHGVTHGADGSMQLSGADFAHLGHFTSPECLKEGHNTTLTAQQRGALAKKAFALPDRRYPIPDASHARNALARVSQHGSPQEKKRVRRRVAKRFPGIAQKGRRR